MIPCVIQLWYSLSSGKGHDAACDSYFKGQSGKCIGTILFTKHTDNSLKLQGDSGMSETETRWMESYERKH